MQVRWREHEIIFVTILTLISVAGDIWMIYDLSTEQIETFYAAPYDYNHISFNYFINILLPGIGSALIVYLCYRLITLLISGLFTSSQWDMFPKQFVRKLRLKKVLTSVSFFLVISYLLALGINTITYYAHPYYFNYAGFKLLSLFGYNDQPLTNLWTGFDRALFLVALYSMYAYVRERTTNYIENSGTRRAYRILIANQVTSFLVAFLSIPFFLSTFGLVDDTLIESYIFIILPALLLSLTNIYWLFPLKGERTFFTFKIIACLVLSVFIWSLPFVFFIAQRGARPSFILIGWAIQLFIITPLSYLFYEQRKDKILQLRGIEKELVKSKTDLQFLRSQINPHFLFNALNTLYGTALREKSQDTAEGIQRLGDMMRFMLQENNLDFISMDREIEYLKNYIALQKLRTQSSPEITIEENIAEQNCDHKIAPMLLIPFVENAFKHGVSVKGKSWIKIGLECNNKTIRFEVRNSMHPLHNNDPEKEPSGIGLKNVLERLTLIYPARHQIVVNGDGKEFFVQLSIQP